MPITAKLDELGRPAWIAADDRRFHHLVAGRPGHARLLDMERTNGMRTRRRPLGTKDGADAAQNGLDARAGWRRPSWTAPRAATAPSTNIAPRRCKRLEDEQTRIPRFPGAAADRQGQDRVRPVHDRAPQQASPSSRQNCSTQHRTSAKAAHRWAAFLLPQCGWVAVTAL